MTGRATKPPSDPTDWAALVEAGLARLEALAGETWTDFNAHDPGVTLLHALAYALTDLGYRAGLPITDLLTGPDGTIDADGACLFPADRILPCAPVTLLDLRKQLLDALPGLRNVWIDRVPGGLGRYRVWLVPAPDADGAELVASAARIASSVRPLGDVFDEVGLCASVALTLSITATVSPERAWQDVLDDAQAAVSAALAPPIVFQPHTGPLAPDLAPDVRYDGPWLAHGTLDDAALWSPRQPAEVAELVREALEHIDGMEDLTALTVRYEAAAADRPQTFTWDAGAEDNQIVINGRRCVPTAGAPVAAARLPVAHDRGAAPPAGAFVDVGRYDAVQDSLPPSYGLEKHGLPPDASAQRIAEVRQLRGYLFVFEQLLANRFAQLEHARTLLSWRAAPTHVWHSLEGLTGADEVLDAGPYAAGRQTIVTAWNQRYGQADAVVDHLLSRFAEAWPAPSWETFETLGQKRRLLAHYPELSAQRHVGFDVARARQLRAPDPDNVSWLERKASLLLAAGPRDPLRAYHGAEAIALQASAAPGYTLYLGRSYYLIEHQLLLSGGALVGRDPGDAVQVPRAFFAGRLSHVLANWTFGALRPEFQAYVEAFLLDAAPAHLVSQLVWCSAAQMDDFTAALTRWYRDGLGPLVVVGEDRDTLWVRPVGAAWDVVRALRAERGAT